MLWPPKVQHLFQNFGETHLLVGRGGIFKGQCDNSSHSTSFDSLCLFSLHLGNLLTKHLHTANHLQNRCKELKVCPPPPPPPPAHRRGGPRSGVEHTLQSTAGAVTLPRSGGERRNGRSVRDSEDNDGRLTAAAVWGGSRLLHLGHDVAENHCVRILGLVA